MSKFTWTVKDGRVLVIEKMETSHLFNAIAYLDKKRDERKENYRLSWYVPISLEEDDTADFGNFDESFEFHDRQYLTNAGYFKMKEVLSVREKDKNEPKLTPITLMKKSTFEIADWHDGSNRTKVCVWQDSDTGLNFEIEGYGDAGTDKGGCPFSLEIDKGVARLLIWGDINDEAATEIISLAGARELKRLTE